MNKKVKEVTNILMRALQEESRKRYNTYTPKNSRKYPCTVPNCPNKAFAKNFCNAHYIRKRRGKSLNSPLRCWNRKTICESCGGKTNSKGGWNLCIRCHKIERRMILKTTLVKYFGGKCKVCKKSFPSPCFDFHHVRGKKAFGIGNMFEAVSVQKLSEEVVKCDLLCANCHRLETNHGKF